ncbi:MAG TPA: glycosyltransferase family 39 protein, partial [Steroidobacteraceae bacterium]|nr:glycosyltransferase family 39 protein [Steroidobacteraceae bacterium]
ALAASFALLGHHEWAARLPSAVAFVATGLLVFGLGRRLCPARPTLPAVVWALSLAPAIASNIVSTDPILVLCETAAMFAFVEAWSRDDGSARRWYVLMWLGWGLAFLAKGPPGLLPLLGIVAFLGVHDRPRLKAMLVPLGLVVFVVVGFTWFGVLIEQDPGRLRYFLGYELYDRVFTGVHDRNAQWYGGFQIYLPMLLVGTLPWSVLALVAAGGPRKAWRRWRDRLRERNRGWLLLTYWLLVPLAAFFMAHSRLHLYVLPLFVPLALIMARALVPWPGVAGRRYAWTVGLSAVALVGFKGLLAYWPSDRDARDVAAQLQRIADMRTIDEVVFVDMRPFYGLNLYLDRHIEAVRTGDRMPRRATFVAEQNLCEELAEREHSIYGTKQKHVARLLETAHRCGASSRRLGSVHADGYEVVFFRLTTGAFTRDSG